MRKNLYGRILKEKPKKQYISTIPKSCSFIIGNNYRYYKYSTKCTIILLD